MAVATIPTSSSNEQIERPGRTMSIEFVAWKPTIADALRKFVDPRASLAVRHEGTGAALEIFTTGDAKAFRQASRGAVTVESELGKVTWQPGRAAILGSATDAETLLPAVIDFAFYEAELRKLEEAILPHQATADADVSLSYNICHADQPQWDRLYQTMEQLYRLRLAFARLEPHLASADLSLPIDARRVFNRLLVKTRIEARLEALNDRLEVLEDLYEGACDRITDYRNYRKGTLLEMGIVVLLLLEVVLLLVQAVHGK